MRRASCSLDISREKIATGIFASRAAYCAIFRAKAVFPMLGRPAMIIKSDFCNPEVISSIFSNPVGTPVTSSFLSYSLSIVLMLSLIMSLKGLKAGLILFSDMSNMACSASSSTVSMSVPGIITLAQNIRRRANQVAQN